MIKDTDVISSFEYPFILKGKIENENDFNNNLTILSTTDINADGTANSIVTPFTYNEFVAKKTELENEETAKVNAKVSGNQKLLDLGLTQAEATALTGYTPPVE